jgi:hypothetical protein
MADDPQDPQDPNDGFHDELAARRAALEAEADATGVSVEELEADGALARTTEEEDGQGAFVWERGRKVSFSSLIKRGTEVEYHVKFGGKSVKGQGEPIPLEESDIVLAGHFVMGGYNIDTVRNDDDTVKKVKVYAKLKPKFYVDPESSQGRALLGASSMLKVVRFLREEGMTEKDIRDELKAALAETAAAA